MNLAEVFPTASFVLPYERGQNRSLEPVPSNGSGGDKPFPCEVMYFQM